VGLRIFSFFARVAIALVACLSLLAAPASAVECNEGTLSELEQLNMGQEYLLPGEEVVTQRIIGKLVQDTRAKGEAVRNQHPKAHGIVTAQFEVEPTLPEPYRIGVFGELKTYEALIRFSNGKERESDAKPDVRGMAIKLVDVPGEKVLEEDVLDSDGGRDQQDFVLINSPVFFADSIVTLAKFAAGDSSIQCAPRILGEIATNGASIASPLDAEYGSTTPYSLGNIAVKYFAQPQELIPPEKSTDKGENYLSNALKAKLGSQDVYFDFFIQPQTNPSTMPIEDATVEWSELESPLVKVATIKIPQQVVDTGSLKNQELEDSLGFTPWHALVEHRPLGNINRARKPIYRELFKLRQEMLAES